MQHKGSTAVFEMAQVKSCGVIVFRRNPEKSFLLMRHRTRWDFPKGHVDPGETELQCALRELVEETGITESQINLDRQFRFTLSYTINLKRFDNELREKTLVLFLGELNQDVDIRLTEHVAFEWVNWAPPHTIQTRTIDPALEAVTHYWAKQAKS